MFLKDFLLNICHIIQVIKLLVRRDYKEELDNPSRSLLSVNSTITRFSEGFRQTVHN